jgi:hypothetical protein
VRGRSGGVRAFRRLDHCRSRLSSCLQSGGLHGVGLVAALQRIGGKQQTMRAADLRRPFEPTQARPERPARRKVERRESESAAATLIDGASYGW